MQEGLDLWEGLVSATGGGIEVAKVRGGSSTYMG
jgi:hypothetical protein